VLRNYPVLAHMRFLLEALRPELQQYFIERNFDGRPYDRDVRSIVYERPRAPTRRSRSARNATEGATLSAVHGAQRRADHVVDGAAWP
jgi:hypothetical protein